MRDDTIFALEMVTGEFYARVTRSSITPAFAGT